MVARKTKKSSDIVSIANNTKRLITINYKPNTIIQRIRLVPGLNIVDAKAWEQVKSDKWVKALFDEGQISLKKRDLKEAKEVTEEAEEGLEELRKASGDD